MSKRPIDVQRESAIQLTIGTDGSPISEIFPIGDQLHVISERAIYRVTLADEVDPERVTRALPNTQIKVLDLGSSSVFVGRILLTAKRLFRKSFLPETFKCEVALELAFEFLTRVVAAYEATEETIRLEAEEVGEFQKRGASGDGVMLPTLHNAEARTATVIQRIDHAFQSLAAIVKLFYGEASTRRWFESVIEHIGATHSAESEIYQAFRSALPTLRLVRSLRNGVEHPRPDRRVVVRNFRLKQTGDLEHPSFEFVDSDTPISCGSLTAFMVDLVAMSAEVFEALVAHLCSANVKPFGMFETFVMEQPEAERRNQFVRWTYGIMFNGQATPIE